MRQVRNAACLGCCGIAEIGTPGWARMDSTLNLGLCTTCQEETPSLWDDWQISAEAIAAAREALGQPLTDKEAREACTRLNERIAWFWANAQQ